MQGTVAGQTNRANWYDRAGRLLAGQQARQGRANRDGAHWIGSGVVEPATEPTGRLVHLQAALPHVHAVEVAAVEVGEARTAHDGELLGVPQLLRRGEGRMQRQAVRERKN